MTTQQLLTGMALAAGLFWVTGAAALPIAAGSELSINGSDTFTATSVTFIGPANIGGQTGSFTILPNCTACVTADAASFTTTSPAGTLLYSATEAGVTSTLVTTALATFAFTPGTLESLIITGPGTLTLTGFDPTPGAYDITTQGPGGSAEVTFSASGIASGVPEPNMLATFAVGLFGLGWFYRRRQRG